MGRVLAWAGAILAGAALGLLSAWACLVWSPSWYESTRDGWRQNRAYGVASAGPYMHAASSTLPLVAPAQEIRLYILDQDEHGAPLSESCIYELSAESFPARWWSVTLYSKSGRLIENGDRAFSLDQSRAGRNADDGWTARLAPVRGASVNWFSTRDARRGFQLALRLYQPRRDIEGREPALPRLQTISCAGTT